MAKDITYNVEAREALKRGVDQLADAVKEVLDLPGLVRLRLGSLESIELSEELVQKSIQNEMLFSFENCCGIKALP